MVIACSKPVFLNCSLNQLLPCTTRTHELHSLAILFQSSLLSAAAFRIRRGQLRQFMTESSAFVHSLRWPVAGTYFIVLRNAVSN